MKSLFQEKQKFSPKWRFILVLGISWIPLLGIYLQIIRGQPFGNNPMSNAGLIIFSVCILIPLILFQISYLSTDVSTYVIKMRFFPFLKKSILWKDIKSADVVNYGFVGGWGIRIGTRYGTVYNTKGRMGLALVLNNGKKVCIGTQKPEELQKVIDNISSGNSSSE